MNSFTVRIFLVGIIFCMTGVAYAADNDSIGVNYEVQAINEISITAASVTLTINTATAGSQPDQASSSTTYDITTNCATDAKKMTAVIDTAMPAGLTLSMNVTAPTGGVSPGAVTITNSAADVVTGIDAVAQSGINMTLYLDATVSTGVVSSASKTLTLTLVDS